MYHNHTVNLILQFPGLFLRKCEVFNNGQNVASLKLAWSFFQRATCQYGDNLWEIREKGFFKTKIQIVDLNTNQLIGEIPVNDKKVVLEMIGKFDTSVATITINNTTYQLSETQDKNNYKFCTHEGVEIITYDLAELTNWAKFGRSQKTGSVSILNNPSKEHLALFMLGLFLLLQRVTRRSMLYWD